MNYKTLFSLIFLRTSGSDRKSLTIQSRRRNSVTKLPPQLPLQIPPYNVWLLGLCDLQDSEFNFHHSRLIKLSKSSRRVISGPFLTVSMFTQSICKFYFRFYDRFFVVVSAFDSASFSFAHSFLFFLFLWEFQVPWVGQSALGRSRKGYWKWSRCM